MFTSQGTILARVHVNKPPLETLSPMNNVKLEDLLRFDDALSIGPAARQPILRKFNTFRYLPVDTALIKHVPKSARSACVNLLSDIL